MSEIKNIKYAGWYASYMDDNQGEALLGCLYKRVKQLEDLLETVSAECELTGEYDSNMIVSSIKHIVENVPEAEHTVGYFTWTTV